MNTDETIHRAIAKAKDLAEYLLRNVSNDSLSDRANGAPTVGDNADSEELRLDVLKDIEHSSQLDMDAEWRQFSRKRLHKSAHLKRLWLAVAAASVLAVVTVTWLFMQRSDTDGGQQYALFDSSSVQPGVRTAVLTVGGDTYRLSASSQLEFMSQQIRLGSAKGNQPKVLKASAGSKATVSVPRGGEYSLVLADGTRVWLNSDTKLTFTAQQGTSERRVTLEGEAYFEVKKNAECPFYVTVGDMQVHVTGTKFNVKARQGVPIVITLESGAVQMERRDGTLMAALRPGEQFKSDADGGSFSVEQADIETALAWKNGKFIFKDVPLSEIAQQLSLWYNVDISVPQSLADRRYSGELNRYKSIEPLLKVLRLTGEMEFIDRGNGLMQIEEKRK